MSLKLSCSFVLHLCLIGGARFGQVAGIERSELSLVFSRSKSHLSQANAHKTLDSPPSTLVLDHRTNTCSKAQVSFRMSQVGTMNCAKGN